MNNELPGIATYYPFSPLLKKYIQYYYFMQSEGDLETSYFVFPNTNTSVNIHKNVSHSVTDNHVEVTGTGIKNNIAILMGMRELPVRVDLKGQLDKITIVFHPLGINHFLNEPYLNLAGGTNRVLHAWNENPQYLDLMAAFYATGDQLKRIQLLESFLLSVYHTVPAAEQLTESIRLLSDFENEKSVAEVAKLAGMPERSFCRSFYRETGISPVRFKKIARFRHSMQSKLFNTEFRRLTEIAYASNFYDQAYFINIYKQLTHKNPTNFFRDLNRLADDRLILSFTNTG
jgi:AraC-like DNA-binding protein